MNLAYAHDANVLIERKIRRVTLIIKPVITNDADRAWMLFNICYHLCGLVHCHNIRIDNGLAAKERIFNPMHSARPWIVEDNCDNTTLRTFINLIPTGCLSGHDVLEICDRNERIFTALINDERQSVISYLHRLRNELFRTQRLYL